MCLLQFSHLSDGVWTVLLICVFWCVPVTTFNAAMQNEVLTLSSENANAVVMSIMSGS